MDNLQVLHNKAAKFVLNLPNRESSTRALTLLSWRPLSARRKIHRCAFVYRAIQSHKGKNPFNFPNLQGQNYHKLQYQRQTEVQTTIMQDQLGQKSILVSFYKRV